MRCSSNITAHLAFRANFGRKASAEKAMSVLTYMNSGLSDLILFTGSMVAFFVAERPAFSVMLA